MNNSQALMTDILAAYPEVEVDEGLNDPHIFKFMHVAGGTGSGKSFIVGKMFKGLGMKFINSDTNLERKAKELGISLKTDLMSPEIQSPERRGKARPGQPPRGVRAAAKKITGKQFATATRSKLGIVMDGTGANYKKIQTAYQLAEEGGYDNFMVFVNVSLPVALERNRGREREVEDKVAQQKWEEVQANLGGFQALFGSQNFIIIDNTEALTNDQILKELNPKMHRAAAKFLNRPILNQIAHNWIKNELRKLTGAVDPAIFNKIIKGKRI